MNHIDAIRDAFLALLKSGMTPLEALREFDLEKFNEAMRDELDSGRLMHEQPDGLPSLLQLAARANREVMNERDMEQAIELWLAGWTSEAPHKTQTDVMSWYWRRPPRRKGKPGRLYWSTTQAFNAMKREGK